MKRLALAALLLLSLVLTACGGTSSSVASNQSQTINWWHISTTDPTLSTFQSLANQYMAAHPNVKVKITVIGNDPFKTKLANAMQAGTPPDVFQSWGGGVLQEYAKAGLVKDITPDLQANGWGASFNKAGLDLYSYNGRNYGVPWDMGAVGFWYNKALFAKAGISTPPATWTDFLSDVQKLKAAGITPIALGEKDEWPGHYYWVYLAMRLGGKTAFDAAYSRKGSFASQPYVEAGQYLQQLIALKPFQNGYLGAGYADEMTAMGAGKAAMELMGQWASAADDSTVAKGGQNPDLGFFPFPAISGGAGNPTDVMGGGSGFAIGKNAPPATVDFVRFLTNAANQRMMAQKGECLPTVIAAQDGITDPIQKQIASMVSNANYYQLYYDQFMPPAVGQTVKDQTEALFAGSATPQQVAQQVETSAAANLTQ